MQTSNSVTLKCFHSFELKYYKDEKLNGMAKKDQESVSEPRYPSDL